MTAEGVLVRRAARPLTRDLVYDRPLWLNLIGGLQKVLLIGWFAFVCLLPTNVFALAALTVLLPLWALVLVIGGWHLLMRPQHRKRAVVAMAALPLTYAAMLIVGQTLGLPVVHGDHSAILFFAVLAAYPTFWLGRWLLQITAPAADKAPAAEKKPAADKAPAADETPAANEPITTSAITPTSVRMRPGELLLLGVVITLAVQAMFLVFVLAYSGSFGWMSDLFGNEWYESLLSLTAVAALVLAIPAMPYALLGLIRGSRHRGVMVAILLCLCLVLVSVFGIYVVFIVLSGMSSG